jgi:hypothetical protein
MTFVDGSSEANADISEQGIFSIPLKNEGAMNCRLHFIHNFAYS